MNMQVCSHSSMCFTVSYMYMYIQPNQYSTSILRLLHAAWIFKHECTLQNKEKG